MNGGLLLCFIITVRSSSTRNNHEVEDPIKKVYIIFSNHLDIGYTKNVNGSTSGAVINQYFHEQKNTHHRKYRHDRIPSGRLPAEK